MSDNQEGTIEKIGIDLAKKALNQANIIIELVDPENMEYEMVYPENSKVLKVINKVDLLEKVDKKSFMYIGEI